MKFVADLHIHSAFSRATSKECRIPTLDRFARIKGIQVLATGDFTHPQWFKHLEETLVEDGRGLLDLKKEHCKAEAGEAAWLSEKKVKFIFSVEISSIYKKKKKVRKVHNVILLPDFKSVKKLNEKLGSIGNIRSDGRPILGLDSKNLLEMVLEICPDSIFIPAHIWTPWFSLFGMNSGFDAIEECYEDLTGEIFALETGLSSDPAMNWRLSALDRFNLVSNSDAHSPANLAREANLFDTDLDYHKIRNALKDKKSPEFTGTVEFFPEEGKYHYDGHRLHHVRLSPAEAKAHKLLCPACHKPVTMGVAHRVEQLADRKEGVRPPLAKRYESLIPLAEIIADAFGAGRTTGKVVRYYDKLIRNAGPELFILREADIDLIKKYSTETIAEGISRVRAGNVKILPGYDGEYGRIIIFSEEDRMKNVSQSLLIGLGQETAGETALAEDVKKRSAKKEAASSAWRMPARQEEDESAPGTVPAASGEEAPDQADLSNPEQEQAVREAEGPVVVSAGPGTGKTRTLISRISYLVKDKNVPPENILAVTFTNRAAGGITERLREQEVRGVRTSTFHGLALDILRENDFNRIIFDEEDSSLILKDIFRELKITRNLKDTQNAIMKAKASGAALPDTESQNIMEIYQARLDLYNGMDYEDIIVNCFRLLNKFPALLAKCRNRFLHILVDEFQDLTGTEYQLMKVLSGTGKNLFVIGDPDQSIYGFRGSSGRFLSELKKDFPLAKNIVLRKNYRNPANIMRAAIDVIRPSSGILKDYEDIKCLVSSGARSVLIEASTELSALIQMARLITDMIGGSSMDQADRIGRGKGYTFRDFAVLVRTSSRVPLIAEVLQQEGIPLKLMGDRSLFESRAERALLDVLRFGLEPRSNFRLLQIFRSGYFGMPDETLKRLGALLEENPDADIMKEAGPASADKNFRLLNIIADERIRGDEKCDIFFRRFPFTFLEEEGMAPFLERAGAFPSLSGLVKYFLLGGEQDFEMNKDGLKKVSHIERVTLLTLHSSKGLEFPVVFLFEPVEGVMPFLDREPDLEEERRLFYVAMTRARERLFFIMPRKRKHFGRIVPAEASRFLRSIPEGLLDRREAKPGAKYKKERSQLTFW